MPRRTLYGAVFKSVGEQSRDGAGSLPTLGIRSHRCLHTYWRGRSMGQIFDHRETVMGAALVDAHSLPESRGVLARRRRLLFDLNAVAYTQSTNTLSMRSPNANLIYSPSRVSQVSCEDGPGFVEGHLTTPAYACRARAASHAPHSPDRACPPRVMCNKSIGIEDRGWGDSRRGGSTYGATNDRRHRLYGIRGARE